MDIKDIIKFMERIAAGIDFIDKTAGGLPKQRMIFLVGEPGSGKSVLSWNFLKDGLMVDEHVLYVSFSAGIKSVWSLPQNLEFDLKWALEQERLYVMDATDYFQKKENTFENAVSLFLNDIEKFIIHNDIKRIVFEQTFPSICLFSAVNSEFFLRAYNQKFDLSERSITSLFTLSASLYADWMSVYFASVIKLSKMNSQLELEFLKHDKILTTNKYKYKILSGKGLVADEE